MKNQHPTSNIQRTSKLQFPTLEGQIDVCVLDFSGRPLLSLTPCFSWVVGHTEGCFNRFNGFPCLIWSRRNGSERKPLKRLTVLCTSTITQLKQGVNESCPQDASFLE